MMATVIEISMTKMMRVREQEQAQTMREWAWVQIMRKGVWLRMTLPLPSITVLRLPQINE